MVPSRGSLNDAPVTNVGLNGSNVSKLPMRSDRSVVCSAHINNAVQRGSSTVSNVLLKSDMFTQTVSNLVNPPVFDTVTSQNVVSIQSTPLYVSSNPYIYAYVNPIDVVASSQSNLGHFDKQEFVSTGRRPTVLPDSRHDDDSEVDFRPGEKPSYAAKTPSRPKPYNQLCLKRHDTVQWEDENTLPKCRDNPEIQQLR